MRIAFIHNNAKTGASVHALMLGCRLQEKMDVTFLLEELRTDGVNFSEIRDVHLFPFTPEQVAERQEKWALHMSLVVRVRMLLFKLKLLRFADMLVFPWYLFSRLEKKWYQKRKAMPHGLVEHLKKYDQNYDCYIVMGNYNSIPFLLDKQYARKTILIPLVHDEKSQFILSAHEITRKFPFLSFNTSAEKELCERIHGKTKASDVIGVGIDPVLTDEDRWKRLKTLRQIPDNYLLYVGRITPRKIGELLPYFQAYRAARPEITCSLVIIGENDANKYIADEHILYLGFVDDDTKADLIAHATVVVNPSRVESLSLIVLEAMSVGVPVLVNGKCEVLKRHCEISGGGFYYLNYKMFEEGLSRLLSDPRLRLEMGKNGQAYQEKNYDWNTILSKTERAIREVSRGNQ